MNVDKVLKRLAKSLADETALRRTGSALGDELPRQRLEVLRAFRAGLASFETDKQPYAAGYLTALADVSASAEAAIGEAAVGDEILAGLSDDWLQLLAVMAVEAITPVELAQRVGKDKAAVSRILTRLRAADLVRDTGATVGDQRRRPQRLTLLGEQIIEKAAQRGRVADPETLLQDLKARRAA